MTQEILNPRINDYLHELCVRRDPVVGDMEAYAAKHRFPIIGPLCGQVLFLLAKAIAARRVFELGSGYGYSAVWFAKAVGSKGKVFCTDGDRENRMRAEGYLTRAGLWEQIDFRVGRAQEIFSATEGEFDIIYNDVDKEQYPQVFELVWSRIRRGGFYIADNALWSGRVVETKVTDDVVPGYTQAIKAHNKAIFGHPEFEATIIPLRDGVIIARRK